MTKLSFKLLASFLMILHIRSPAIGSSVFRPNSWCNKAQGLSDAQRRFCRRVPGLHIAIKTGIEEGLSECEREFMRNRWNCTLLGEKSFFQRAPDGTREAAFTTAMLSAALAYKVALACIAKNVTECSCEKVEHSFRGESWKWTGCSVNVVFGSYTAARFMLSARSNNSQIDMMKMHNVRVGLEVLKENRVVKCKVGKRGNAKACLMTFPPLFKISRMIKSKYNNARNVIAIQRKNKQAFYLKASGGRPNRPNLKRPSKSELIFISQSPTYCYRQDKYRIPGTRGRKCHRNTHRGDDCVLMCCGRGYKRSVHHKERLCHCSRAENEQCRCKVRTDVVIENNCL